MPEQAEAVYFNYLVELRDSGVTNMFGAGPYLEEEFGLPQREAKDILMAWMKSFKD
tara:strand:+ start:347 stop:514 length:168 start_codon:yes stop_codon:yes gene_type:complete